MRGQIGDLGCTHLHRVLKLAALERELAARPVHSHVVCHEEALRTSTRPPPCALRISISPEGSTRQKPASQCDGA
jgi:hypothetical protein